MKKRYLIIVSQLFQLMVAAHLKETVLNDGDVDLIILEETSAGLRDAYLKIKDLKYFSNIYFVASDSRTRKDKIKSLVMAAFGKYDEKLKREIVHDNSYDQILNVGCQTYVYLIWSYLNTKQRINIYFFDEGPSPYLGQNNIFEKCSLRSICYGLADMILAIRRRPRILDKFKGYYLFYPGLLQIKTRYSTYQIPRIDPQNAAYRSFIQAAFGDTSKTDLDAKYIFFEDNIFDDSIDDFSLIMKIAEKVGKENIVVKLHPRRNKDRFSDQGIKVSKSTGIPWEAFLLTNDFTDKVILTISSSVAFSSRLYFDMDIPTIMLYKITGVAPNVAEAENYVKYAESFRQEFGNREFYTPNSMDELLALL